MANTKKAYTAKDKVYNGTHGNLSGECFQFDIDERGPFLLFAVIDPAIGQEQKHAQDLYHDTHTSKSARPTLQSFSVISSDMSPTTSDTPTVYAVDAIPKGASLNGVVWSVSDGSIATAQSDGNISFKKAGTVEVIGTIGSVVSKLELTIT